jgi:hypothetical protein
MLVSGCNTNRNDIDKWVKNGDDDALKAYILKNCNSKDSVKSSIASYAIQQMIFMNMQGAVGYFENCYFGNEKALASDDIKQLILKSFVEKNIAFTNQEQFLAQYCDKILANTNIVLSYEEKMIQLFDLQKCNKFIFQKAVNKLNENQITFASQLFNIYNKLKLPIDSIQNQVKNITLELARLKTNKHNDYADLPEMISLKAKKETIFKKYARIQDSLQERIKKIKAENSEIMGRISSLESSIEDTRESIKNFNFINLSGFICGVNYDGSYEINTGGRYHAILITSTRDYNTKGYFNIPARKTDTRQVSVKEEYGGFTQTWNVYEEVTPSEISSYNEDKRYLSSSLGELAKIKQQIKPSLGKIKSLEISIVKSEQSRDLFETSINKEKAELVKAFNKKIDDLTFEIKKILLLM